MSTAVFVEQDRTQEIDRELRQAIAELSLISHGPTMAWDRTARDTSDAPGGRRPGQKDSEPRPRDKDEFKAWLESYHRKTPDWFRRQRERALGNEQRLMRLRDDCRRCIDAWRKCPPQPSGIEPERGSFVWKCQIADDDRGTIKQREDLYGVDRSTIYRYRSQYRGLRRGSAIA